MSLMINRFHKSIVETCINRHERSCKTMLYEFDRKRSQLLAKTKNCLAPSWKMKGPRFDSRCLVIFPFRLHATSLLMIFKKFSQSNINLFLTECFSLSYKLHMKSTPGVHFQAYELAESCVLRSNKLVQVTTFQHATSPDQQIGRQWTCMHECLDSSMHETSM